MLGAHVYIDTNQDDAVTRLKEMGGAQAIVATIGNAAVISALIGGLAPQGRLIMLGVGKDPLSISTGRLVAGERSIAGSITGSPYENEKALDFSVLTGVRPRIETTPLENAYGAYLKMKHGNAMFRMVLSMRRQAEHSSDNSLRSSVSCRKPGPSARPGNSEAPIDAFLQPTSRSRLPELIKHHRSAVTSHATR
jgi:alcohol dehydrogenase